MCLLVARGNDDFQPKSLERLFMNQEEWISFLAKSSFDAYSEEGQVSLQFHKRRRGKEGGE